MGKGTDDLKNLETAVSMAKRGAGNAGWFGQSSREKANQMDAELGLRDFRVALKTGTAETVSKDGGENTAWLVGYAPASAVDVEAAEDESTSGHSPRIAFAVVIEETDLHGGEACAPVVRSILEYFADNDPQAYRLQDVAALEGGH